MNQDTPRRQTVSALILVGAGAPLLALGAPAVAIWAWLLGLCCAGGALIVLTARDAPTPRTRVALIGAAALTLLVLLAARALT
jgi:hypothetical protein